MKKVILSLSVIALLISCNSNEDKKSSTESSATESSNFPEIESVKLFADLKADEVVASQNYLNKSILLKGLLAYDGYIDTLGKRVLICVPIDEVNYNIGFLHENNEQVGENKTSHLGFWNPEALTDFMVGRTRYMLNGQKLGMIYTKMDKNPLNDLPEIRDNRITMQVQFEDANDYTKLKLPSYEKFKDGDARSKATFYEILDIEGTVIELTGGKQHGETILLRGCKLVNQRQPTANNVSTKNETTLPEKVETKKNTGESTITGTWKGSFGKDELTIVIESIDANGVVKGYDEVKGNRRTLKGNLIESDNGNQLILNEPGDDKWDGEFKMNYDKLSEKLIGEWNSNNGKMKKEFKLIKNK